ncbi:hypothetical protein [Halochromatium roseum]|uniref:hypothetical protein n=1 Tax=Halochromatium roseum TaxID=391920 RepID=UPI0019143D36|nr:hypothetical protein [Halochromatium roseum]MBK5938568.1 hypothetical protein [Halochromatium roseum]
MKYPTAIVIALALLPTTILMSGNAAARECHDSPVSAEGSSAGSIGKLRKNRANENFRQGAIDFWVKYDPQWLADGDRRTLVTYSNGYETLFEIAMAPAGDGIWFSNGSGDGFGGTRERFNSVAADFTDGRFHNVAAVAPREAGQCL